MKITTSKKTCWAGRIGAAQRRGCGSATVQLTSSNGAYIVNVHKTRGPDGITVALVVNGKKVSSSHTNSTSVVSITHSSG